MSARAMPVKKGKTLVEVFAEEANTHSGGSRMIYWEDPPIAEGPPEKYRTVKKRSKVIRSVPGSKP